MKHFSYFVIGGGSGGIASARRAASYGASVGVAEAHRWGGTCVNVGCVPKKMMWCCASVKETLTRDMKHYGFHWDQEPEFSWAAMKARRDATIERLNNIYVNNLAQSGVEYFESEASFLLPTRNPATGTDMFNIKLSNHEQVSADKVLIATGSYPTPLNVPNGDLCITSDDFFALETQPKKVAVIGAGYIAVELAGVLQILGTDTTLITRGATALRKFDEMLRTQLRNEMVRQGCTMVPDSQISKIRKEFDGTLTVVTDRDQYLKGFDHVLIAIGRSPNTKHLGLENLPGLKFEQPEGFVAVVDEFQSTSISNLFALGDVCGKIELTPMAIAAGRRLADRLFGGQPMAKADYCNVPTVIFSHPPIGSVGMTEEEALKCYGRANVVVFKGTSVNLYYSSFDIPPSEKPKTLIKLVCLRPSERILGIHIIGMGADEILQGFAVALKMKATKADLDSCVAIHPTAAEELVTLAPWGLPAPPLPSEAM